MPIFLSSSVTSLIAQFKGTATGGLSKYGRARSERCAEGVDRPGTKAMDESALPPRSLHRPQVALA